LVSSVQDELRKRREAQATYRALERELASYRTRHEIADLLGTISDQESPEAEQIRDILLNNQRPTTALYRAS
jgi:hypothetical protein